MAHYTKGEARDWAWDNLTGQWSTLVTPFSPDDQVDEAGLRRNIRHIRSLGARGAGATWGMGEFWSLTREERFKVYDILADESRGEWLTAAHVTHTSIKEATLLADYAQSAGIELLIVAPPYIVTRKESQVIDFVRLLAGKTDLAIMFYNSPQFGIVLGAPALKELCAIPNVVGVKEASFNRDITIEAHRTIGKDAIISAPDEWILLKGRELGIRQQVMFANTSDWRFDRPGANYYTEFIDRATAGDIDDNFYDSRIRPIKAVSDRWWQRMVQQAGGVLPAAMCKHWGEVMGMAGGGVRPPLVDLTPDEKEELKADILAVQSKVPSTVGD
ncbi:MAG: dihydrodipicolinate synthase family protein [SAR202 cluster bacterium]|nr:dihydrodipicolinate synthase family protein [SAR202 cluster bacterium]